MTIPSYLAKRGKQGIYQLRLRIPKDLVPAFRRREFTKSLGTSDLKVAQRLARPILYEWERSFDQARMKVNPTSNELSTAAKEHYERKLREDDKHRDQRPPPSEIERQKTYAAKKLRQAAREGKFEWENRFALFQNELDHPILLEDRQWDRMALEIRLGELRKHLAEGEIALVQYAADEFLQRYKLDIDENDPNYRQLCRKILRAEIEQLERIRERNQGVYSGQPKDALFAENGSEKFKTTTFSDIIDKQARLSESGIGSTKVKSTIVKYRKCTDQFVIWRGSDRVVSVTKMEVEEWRDQLLSRYARKTVRDKISIIRTVLEWGQRQSDGNLFEKRFPLDTLELPSVEKSDSSDKTYTLETARLILREARVQTLDYKRWVPWILAYSGARIDEIMQLEKADVFEYEGFWFYHIRVGIDRSTKTKNARKVPIHSALIAEGFLDFVSSAPAGPLFPATRAAQNIRDWLRKDVLKEHPEPRPAPNHGFRHLFEDLRRSRLDIESANYITGRANKGSEEAYGKSNVRLPALARQMENIPPILPLPKSDSNVSQQE